jgi:3-methyladenine DNA glycosylase AlkD
MNEQTLCLHIVEQLKQKQNPVNVEGMKRFGIVADNAFGIKLPELRLMAKPYRKNNLLAFELWKTKYHEARLLAALIADYKTITEKQLDIWVHDFNSWDICDQVSFGLICNTSFYRIKIVEYAQNEKEYVRRTAFATIAGLALKSKNLMNEEYIEFLDLIEKYSYDDRNFVKKAVNWALRQIGKRNKELCLIALTYADRIKNQNYKSSRWIAADAIRELEMKIKNL